MKILVLSDIHANIWALRKILETEQNVDKICFAGDMVDYGIAPAEVIEWFRTHSDTIAVKGNHDAYAVKLFYQKDFKNIPSKKYKWIHYNLEK